VPAEVHEYRDPAGDLLGTITVRRESTWDDIAREQAFGLVVYDESLCGCGCGLPRDVAHDSKQLFVVDEEKCYAGRALEMVRRKKREEAELRNLPEGWDDGVHYFPRPIAEDEAQAQRRSTRRG
jgi:hypothetical protein